jgi:hypothetical protein
MKSPKIKTVIEIIVLLLLMTIIFWFVYNIYIVGHLGDDLGI